MSIPFAVLAAQDAGVLFATQHSGSGAESRSLQRDVERGTLVRISRGAYLDAQKWGSLYPAARYRLRLLANTRTMQETSVFSHQSAAAFLGIRLLGQWPSRVTTTINPRSTSRSTGKIQRIRAPLSGAETVEVLGLRCTSPARTVADLARTLPFADAVASADSALHRKRKQSLLTLLELETQVARMGACRGHRLIARVADFATPLSDSVQESRSRVLIHELGFPAPVLQQPWRDSFGYIGETDFWWPDYMVAGEFDGLVKYLDREMRGKRTPEQVLIAEKRREDRIRRQGVTMARWVTKELDPPSQLRTILLEAGLPFLAPSIGAS